MQLYDFEVLKGEEIIAAELSVPLPDTRAAMAKKIARIAKNYLPCRGCRIRVREHSGDTIILIGAAAAQHYADPALIP